IVNFDHKTVRSDCYPGTREGCDHVCGTGAMRGIDDDRQMRNAPNRRHRCEVERVTRMLRECANASLAKYDIVVALSHDVLGCEQPFLECCSHPALQQHGQLGSACSLQERKILHVASTDLNDITVLFDQIDMRFFNSFGDNL